MSSNRTFQAYALTFGKNSRRQEGRFQPSRRKNAANSAAKPSDILEVIPGYLAKTPKPQAA